MLVIPIGVHVHMNLFCWFYLKLIYFAILELNTFFDLQIDLYKSCIWFSGLLEILRRAVI